MDQTPSPCLAATSLMFLVPACILYKSASQYRRTLSFFVLGVVITSLCYHGTGNDVARIVDCTMVRMLVLLTLPLVDMIVVLLFSFVFWIYTSPITHDDTLHLTPKSFLIGTNCRLKTQYHVLMHCVGALCLVHCAIA